jgi:hypothetical protein
MPLTAADERHFEERAAFEAAYSEWLAVRAALSGADGDKSDKYMNALNARERAAELALIGTRAPLSFAVWRKWELLEKLMTSEQDAGQDAWSLAIVTAAAPKADILYLGLKDGR